MFQSGAVIYYSEIMVTYNSHYNKTTNTPLTNKEDICGKMTFLACT